MITPAEARRRWRTRAGQLLARRVIREEPVCWLQFPGVCTGAATTADHVQPVTRRPDLVLVRSNLRGACSECNRARNSTPVEALSLGSDTRPPALDIFGS
jgi:5-methylcytosine-specific restriction endonuclease McrA